MNTAAIDNRMMSVSIAVPLLRNNPAAAGSKAMSTGSECQWDDSG